MKLHRFGRVKAASLPHDAQQVLAVAALRERLGELEQSIGVDEAVAPGDLLHARHFQSLPLLDDAHEHAGIEQRIVGAGIEPGRAAPEPLDVQRSELEVRPIEIRDLELAARRRRQGFGERARARVVEIDAGDRIVGRRPGRLFQQFGHPALGVEFDDSVALGILHVIAEHRGALGALRSSISAIRTDSRRRRYCPRESARKARRRETARR